MSTRLLKFELDVISFGKLKKGVPLKPRITEQVHNTKLEGMQKNDEEMLSGDGTKNRSLSFLFEGVELVIVGTNFEECWGEVM